MLYMLFDLCFLIEHRYEMSERMLKSCMINCEEKPVCHIKITDTEIENEKKRNPDYSIEYCEVIAIQRKIAEILPGYSGFFIHSASVSIDKTGYLFLGLSRAGKSTHASGWVKYLKDKNAQIINDDKAVIRIIDNKAYIYKNPLFSKVEEKNEKILLKAAYFINQSKVNSIKKTDIKKIIPKLINQTHIPGNAELKIKYYETLDMFVNSILFYDLWCDISSDAVYMAYNEVWK